ncbi:hypothetical protein HMPREF3187_01538 [Aerococcus christensenii]|uniref:Uncharacterized protein n=1 Tax=Aerococcus christensenii TaxID=87541 RepID=A0A133XSX2_9LACT|nr:hypothetical protein HMPREF3187_01538 [Aerococcus christensenii]
MKIDGKIDKNLSVKPFRFCDKIKEMSKRQVLRRLDKDEWK